MKIFQTLAGFVLFVFAIIPIQLFRVIDNRIVQDQPWVILGIWVVAVPVIVLSIIHLTKSKNS